MIVFAALALAAAPAATDPLSIQSLHVVGECVASTSPATAREVLEVDFRSREYSRRLRDLGRASGRCMPQGLQARSSGLLFAGAIAEALLKAEVNGAALPARLAYDPARALIEARSATDEMALCTVMRAPGPTAALLQTEPATREEADAETVLQPVLNDCLKKGENVELNRPAMRSLLALAAYRIATTPARTAE